MISYLIGALFDVGSGIAFSRLIFDISVFFLLLYMKSILIPVLNNDRCEGVKPLQKSHGYEPKISAPNYDNTGLLNKFIEILWPTLKNYLWNSLPENISVSINGRAPCLKNILVADDPTIPDDQLWIYLHLAWKDESEVDFSLDIGGTRVNVNGLNNLLDLHLQIRVDLQSLKKVAIDICDRPVNYQSKREGWLNTIVKRVWTFVNKHRSSELNSMVSDLVNKTSPISLSFDLVLGKDHPRIGFVRVQDEKNNDQTHKIVIDLDVKYKGQCKVSCSKFYLLKGGITANSFDGRLRFELQPLVDQSPFFEELSVGFTKEPELDFEWGGIAYVSSWLFERFVSKEEIVTKLFDPYVLPNKYTITLIAKKLNCKNCKATIVNLDKLHHIPSRSYLKEEETRQTLGSHKAVAVQRFRNPHGYRFNVVTFCTASVTYYTQGYLEATWFEGYKWHISECTNCKKHIGWRYHSKGRRPETFYGLIIDRLEEA